ncbi:MAG: SDR family oxidoreductase [Chitinophagaceae bacterium]
MKVFVTGATGFVGTAVVKELIGAGHQVLGLVRSEASANALKATGATVHMGDLEDLDSLRKGVEATDGIIHTGFIHDFSRFKEVCETDRRAIEAMGAALAGTNKPMIVTSGTALVQGGKLAVETDMAVPSPNPRLASEQAVDAIAAKGTRVAVVRLPPSTHGEGDHGFVPMLINFARQKNLSAYKGDGQNRWPAAHRFDAAKVYRLALESNFAAGTRFHAVAEEGITFKQIAETIGKHLNVPVVSLSPEEAAAHFEWFAHFAGINNPSSSEITQKTLGWKAEQIGLIEDMERNGYFKA